MTNPVVLYGTQSNGETLPVQVDATGRLVAEGLQGSEGEQGPPGNPGQDGGSFPLPPDPYEGALLGWLNGELAWVGTPPVPIPEGLFGPIVSYEQGLIVVEGSIPAEVENGVYLIQTDEAGNPTNPLWNQPTIWSAFCSAGSGTLKTIERAFDGNETTKGEGTGGLLFQPDNAITFTSSAEVLVAGPQKLIFNGSEVPAFSGDKQWITLSNVPGSLSSLQAVRTDNPGWDAGWYMIKLDGVPLVNADVRTTVRVNQVVNETTLLGVVTDYTTLTPGLFLLVETQRVAPWVYFQNRPEDFWAQAKL